MSHDLVLAGGRVVDPETGFDRVCDVGIDADSVTALGDRLDGVTTVDVGGLVVAPGFVDLHSHAQTLPGRRLQACDGVTTALDLEAGRAPVDLAYAREAKRGSPINYGFSASWAAARMHAVADGPLDGGAATIFAGLAGTAWQQAATTAQLARILDQISTDLAAGAVGVGVLIGYTPGVDPAEYLAVAELAAAAGVPTFTHSRDVVEMAPETLIDGAEEVVRAAGTTGAHVHYCHINSTSGRHIDRVLALVGRCQAEGGTRHDRGVSLRVGVDGDRRLVPGTGATAGALPEHDVDHVSPHWRAHRRRGPAPRAAGHGPRRSGHRRVPRRVRTRRRRAAATVPSVSRRDRRQRRHAAHVDRLCGPGPHGLALAARSGHPPPHRGHVRARPATVAAGGHAAHGRGPPRDLASHRGAPERGPAMRRKGRVQAGADADLVVFDEAGVTDQATYAASTRPSAGIAHVIVGGTFVVRDGELVPTRFRGGRCAPHLADRLDLSRGRGVPGAPHQDVWREPLLLVADHARTAVASTSTSRSGSASASTPIRVTGRTGSMPSRAATRPIPSPSAVIISGCQSTM